jgi:chromosome segregation ATPase
MHDPLEKVPFFFVFIIVGLGESNGFLINGNSNHSLSGPAGTTGHSEIDTLHLLLNQETYFCMELEKTLHQVSHSVDSLTTEVEILKKENKNLKMENSRLSQNMSDIVSKVGALHSVGSNGLQEEVSMLTSDLVEAKTNMTSVNAVCHSVQERLNDFILYTTHDMNEFSALATHMQRDITSINMILKGLSLYQFKVSIT